MLGSGKQSGMINEAGNLLANENLTDAVQYMATHEYQQQRDMNDVIPTHMHEMVQKVVRDPNKHLTVFNPEKEKIQNEIERQYDDDFDAELEMLRERRKKALMVQQDQMTIWKGKHHGQYREIAETDFFMTVVREKGGSDDVAVHFYHKDFEKCKVMDRYLSELALETMNIKFVKIDAERAPFLVERLKVTVLPCVLLFHNDVCVDRIIGFEDMGVETIDPVALRLRILSGLKMNSEE